MANETPERLKSFRESYDKKRSSSGPSLTGLAAAVVVALIAGYAIAAVVHRPSDSPTSGGMTADQWREYALYLEGKNATASAIDAYARYLERASLTPAERSKVCFSVAKLAIDTENYETALEYLYQAEMLAPQSDLKGEIDKKIVLCLEKLGRMTNLRRELRARSETQRSEADLDEDEVVLAKYGDAVVTNRDLDAEIAKLPPAARDSFAEVERRKELLRNLVAERVLVDKARRLELEKDPKVQEVLAEQLDSLAVRQLIANEVAERVHVTSEDVERFYRAEPDRFTIPTSANVRATTVENNDVDLSTVSFDRPPFTIRSGSGIRGIPDSERYVDHILGFETGEVTEPIRIGQQWHVFKIESKTPSRLRPFDEVKTQTEQLYRTQKEQEVVQALMQESVQAQNVQFYFDRMQEEAPKE